MRGPDEAKRGRVTEGLSGGPGKVGNPAGNGRAARKDPIGSSTTSGTPRGEEDGASPRRRAPSAYLYLRAGAKRGARPSTARGGPGSALPVTRSRPPSPRPCPFLPKQPPLHCTGASGTGASGTAASALAQPLRRPARPRRREEGGGKPGLDPAGPGPRQPESDRRGPEENPE